MSIDKEAEAFKPDIEYLVTGCMMSKNDSIRIETYSAIYKITNVFFLPTNHFLRKKIKIFLKRMP